MGGAAPLSACLRVAWRVNRTVASSTPGPAGLAWPGASGLPALSERSSGLCQLQQGAGRGAHSTAGPRFQAVSSLAGSETTNGCGSVCQEASLCHCLHPRAGLSLSLGWCLPVQHELACMVASPRRAWQDACMHACTRGHDARCPHLK